MSKSRQLQSYIQHRGPGRPKSTQTRPTAWVGTHVTELERADLQARHLREGSKFCWSQWLRGLLGLPQVEKKREKEAN